MMAERLAKLERETTKGRGHVKALLEMITVARKRAIWKATMEFIVSSTTSGVRLSDPALI